MAGVNNYNGMAYRAIPAAPNNGVFNNQVYPANSIPQTASPIYVHGIDGANAFQMPYGVSKVILWDDEVDSFYIKALDPMGRPKVIAWKDFSDHVIPAQPERTDQAVDFSVYPTKKDLEDMLAKYDTSKYITKDDLDKAISELFINAQGRIMRNELNA